MKIDDVDLAKTDPCAGGCGTSVRRMASVPIRGNGLDAEPSSQWWCPACLQAKCDAAMEGIVR